MTIRPGGGPIRRLMAVMLTLALAVAVPGTAAAGESDPDPLGLLVGGGVTERLSIGTDRVAVMVCDFPGADINLDPSVLASWAESEVAPFFAVASRGRYAVTFSAGSTFMAPSMNACLEEGRSATPAGFSNVMVVTNSSTTSGGFGGPGLTTIGPDGTVTSASLDQDAAVSRRGFIVHGGDIDRPLTFAHEIGHTLGWPHSGSTANSATSGPTASDYDNLSDLMSGAGGIDNGCFDGAVTFYPCNVVHTSALNRYSSGWIDLGQVEKVVGGPRSGEIRGPETGTGTQMALIPSDDPLIFAVVDSRPPIGYDLNLGSSGVSVHIVDQTGTCSSLVCWGILRRQYSALVGPTTEDHFLSAGESHDIFGVTVTVDGATAHGYDVSFSGRPDGCAMGPNPFTDLATTSFAFDSVGCIRILGITTGTSPTTYAPGDAVTREQMAAFLGRLWDALGQTCPSSEAPFTDVADTSFAHDAVDCIFGLGITKGTSPTTYGPSDTVTREQMAAFIARLWRALGNSCPTDSPPFLDIAGSFAEADVACIFGLGITTGTSHTTYGPSHAVTREQMAAFIARLWNAAWA